ncbi:MAG: dephospho-CoA kinase [Bacteroidales bacterium]|nr:dephospho-CoA kinase [Bacteroidales bacterium]
MRTIGLTGGIGSGKSMVAEIFTHLGIPVFNADAESKQILREDTVLHDQLSQLFGPGIFNQGIPDRKKLAEILFLDREKMDKMNGLIHPRVIDRFVSWCKEHQQSPYLVHEAAILFETGFYRLMDLNILVVAPDDIRIKRVMERDQTTEKLVRERMQNQWTDEQKKPLADIIMINDGESPLLPQVLEIHNKLIE